MIKNDENEMKKKLFVHCFQLNINRKNKMTFYIF